MLESAMQPKNKLSNLEIPLWILAILATGFLLHEASTIFLWIVCSFFIFAVLDPSMQHFGRKGVAPIISSLAVVTLVSGVAFACVFLAVHFSGDLSHVFESYRKTLIHLYNTSSASIEHHLHALSRGGGAIIAPSEISQVQVVDPSPLSGGLGARVAEGVSVAFTGIAFGALCPILTFFMIAERATLSSAFARLFDRNGAQSTFIWSKITAAIRAFFFGNLVLGAICFPIFCILFGLFHVQTPYALAAAASLFNLIPFLGAFLAGVIPALDLLSQSSANTGAAVGLMAICLAIHFTVANLVTPKILGSKLDLNATTSTIALIVWGEIWGGFGLLLAIPIMACVKILLQSSRSPQLHWFALLMSDDPQSLINQTQRNVFPKRVAKGPRPQPVTEKNSEST